MLRNCRRRKLEYLYLLIPLGIRTTKMSQTRQIAGSRILITGATQGIGRSIAVLAARQGGKLVVNARSAGDVDQLVKELEQIGAEAVGVAGDVTNPDDRRRMLDAAVERFGGLDILINN